MLGVGNNSAAIVAFSTVSGGAVAELTGGNFWQGAASGFMVSSLNHAMHTMDDIGDDPPTKMKSASSYDYNQMEISGKFSDDMNYLLNGDNGNYFSRAWDLMSRDWGMASTGDKIELALSATPFRVFRIAGSAFKAEISFGRNANQVYHAFRHTDAMGLSRDVVQSGVLKHLPTVISKVKPGYPLNVITKINGVRLQYSVFKLSDGTYNIGRIHGAF